MGKIREAIAAALAETIEVDEKKLDRKKYPDVQKARATYIGEVRNKKVRDIRAKAVKDAFDKHRGKNDRGELTIRTRTGAEVTIDNVVLTEYNGVPCVEIGGVPGNPAYRIINPPTLVEDGTGDVEIKGKKFREDPLGAIAESIASVRNGKKVRR